MEVEVELLIDTIGQQDCTATHNPGEEHLLTHTAVLQSLAAPSAHKKVQSIFVSPKSHSSNVYAAWSRVLCLKHRTRYQ